ncbi:hypothetical protein GJ629_04655 [Halapricum sp. CBA1109]|nr:hypothetical protein [Halapricum sp. CBA1109]
MLFSGPAGTGKCVTGETPVVTNDGLHRIEDVVGDGDGFEPAASDLEVLSLTDEGEFEYVTPSHCYSDDTDIGYEITTRDGSTVTTTPEHRMLVLSEDGLSWRQAFELDAGDRIVRPLEAPLPATDRKIDWIEALDGERTLVTVSESFSREYDIPPEAQFVGQKKQIVEGLRRGATAAEVAADVSTTEKYAKRVERDVDEETLAEPSTVCSLATIRELDASRAELRKHVESIQRVAPTNNRRSSPITPVWETTPELGAFLGLALSEARIENGRIKFYNTDDDLLDRFEQYSRELFGLEPKRGCQKDVPYVAVNTRTLTTFLESCFDVFDDGDAIAGRLLRADDRTRAAFLRAMFDAEAYVSDSGILELSQKDGDLITLLSYLLAGFGIPSRRAAERKCATNGSGIEREYHTLKVSGAAHLATFEDEVGFTIDHKAERLSSHADTDGNPNHDTMPVQATVDELCARTNLQKSALVPDTLNPETPGRERYQTALGAVVDSASARLEAAQEVRETIDSLRPQLRAAAGIPVQWDRSRAVLTESPTQETVAERTGVSAYRLGEYGAGDRSPRAGRTVELLGELDGGPNVDLDAVQRTLADAVDSLGVEYTTLADGTELRGTDIGNLLTNDDWSLRSLPRFQTVARQVESAATEILSTRTVELLTVLDTLAEADLYVDEVETVERVSGERAVYDLTVPRYHNYVGGTVPTVMHNTTSAMAIAKELYGDDWEENFLELNASDQRGIDVVRDRVKSFARTSFGGYEYRIIFLDEADALCVPPGTEVVTGYPSSPEVKPIEEVDEDGEPIPSVDFETNEIQSDKGHLVESGVADFFELELADGRSVLASLSHPFFVVGEDGTLVEKELRELSPGDEIADFKDDIGVSQCEICEDWTAGRFCSLECKNDGHSRDMQGEGNPMHGTEWSDERREKIVAKLADGRLEGEDNPNYGGDFHGVSVWEMDEETIDEFREKISDQRSGTTWDEWVVDADPEAVKEQIGQASAEWWESIDEDEKERVIQKATERCDYPVCDITGDNNPMRDPEVAQKVSEALQGHEPTGGNIRHSDELGHLVRSDWEYEVGKTLQEAGIEYEYEPEFELSDSVFHPDFLVDDTVIEVKGSAKLWGQTEKVNEFLETYGDDYRFIVVGDSELPHHEHYDRDEFEASVVADGGLQRVETVEVSSIEYSHRGEAYNISMDGTPNFMLANGVLTHNTSDAQSALRRTMEQFSNNVRFILSCNYSSQIIDPIQSRCAVFRFSPLSDDAVESQVRRIASAEGIEVTDDGVDALVYIAGGDMRKAINGLQAASVSGAVVDEETVFEITSTARPEDIREMIQRAIDGDFTAAQSELDRLLTEEGIAGGDVLDQLHRSVWEFDLDDAAAVRVLDRVGEADYRITEGASERIQLEALLASLALEE